MWKLGSIHQIMMWRDNRPLPIGMNKKVLKMMKDVGGWKNNL